MSFQTWQQKMMGKIFLVLLLFASCKVFAQPENNFNLKKLTDSIQSIVNRDHVPGLMLGITTKDSLIFAGGFGDADIKAKRPADATTLFRLGSITKMFISLSILKLVKEGKIQLNDELKKVAPEVPFTNAWEQTNPVKIIHLLEHTAAFDDMKLNRMCAQNSREYTGKEMMLMQANSLVCRWKPGERYSYCNPGYAVLGYIIEKITGKSYGQYIADNILLPLGMQHSNFNAFSKIPGSDTKQYVVHGGKIIEVPSVNCLMAPAGALWSCADDMVKLLRLFLANGQPLFTGIQVHEMETTHSSLAAKAGLVSGYGLANTGMFIYEKSAAWRGHTGLMGTCFSTFSYNRELGAGFIMSSNGNQQNGEIERLIADYLEQHTLAKKLDTMATDLKAIAPFNGQYLFENPRNQIGAFKDKLLNTHEVYVENNAVFVKALSGDKIRLVQTAANQFARVYANTATVIFTKNSAGKNVMIMDGNYYEQSPFFVAKGKFWMAVLAVFLALSAALAGIISSVGFYTRRVKRNQFLLRLLPVLGLAMLALAVKSLLSVQSESYLLSELTTINVRTIVIFAGTLIFGLFALLHLVVVLGKLNQFKNKLYAFYWLMATLSICYIAFVLFQNGWIGLRTWAM